MGIPATIALRFEPRPDGGLRIYSDDVPGFVLSHADAEAAFGDIGPVLWTILTFTEAGGSGASGDVTADGSAPTLPART